MIWVNYPTGLMLIGAFIVISCCLYIARSSRQSA
jgi:hypothetical protein